MRAIPVIALVGLLLLPGCTYFDESGSESETEEVLEPEVELRQGCTDPEANNYDPVSYTHLTLPTNSLV